jgi:hypothetical protein
MYNSLKGDEMASNYEAGKLEIPARIYPGMFRGEVQATVRIGEQEINLIVPDDSVKYSSKDLTNDGVDGIIFADIVSATPDGYLVNLPGEVQGATNRIEYATA